MRKSTIPSLLISLLLLFACGQKFKAQPTAYKVRADIRFGSRFYSIYVNELGESCVIKGNGSSYTEPFTKIFHADTGKVFRSDSLKMFFYKVRDMKNKPIIMESNTVDAARIETYYDGKKVYDAYGFNRKRMLLFRPIMAELPKGFNPFLTDDHPFD